MKDRKESALGIHSADLYREERRAKLERGRSKWVWTMALAGAATVSGWVAFWGGIFLAVTGAGAAIAVPTIATGFLASIIGPPVFALGLSGFGVNRFRRSSNKK